MLKQINQSLTRIAELCQKYRVKRLELFGSAASDTFDPLTSDIDFFYEFDERNTTDLADRFFGLKEDLEQLLKAPVDLVSAIDVTNPYFLQVANRYRQTLYAA